MKTLIQFLLCFFAAFPLAAATVTGTLTDVNGNAVQTRITFDSISAPISDPPNTIVRSRSVLTNSAAGYFSVVLAQGNYAVKITSTSVTGYESQFSIYVPAGTATYALTDLVNTVGNLYNPLLTIQEVDGLPILTGVTNLLVTNGTLTSNGVHSATLTISGGSGSQTPWTSAIDGGGYALTNWLAKNLINLTTNSTSVLKIYPTDAGGFMMTNVGEALAISSDGTGVLYSWVPSSAQWMVGSKLFGMGSDGTISADFADITGTGTTGLAVESPVLFRTNLTVRGLINAAADAGATDAYAITLNPAWTGYATGQQVWFKANTANTGAATLNVNGLGAKTIVKLSGDIATTLANNDIRAGQWVHCIYDGTNFQMQSQVGNAPGGSGDALVANPLSQFAATTSAQLRSVLSDEDGTGVFLTANGSGTGLSGVALSSIHPNTAPSAGQVLVGNAGGTAYAPVSVSGDATLASTGALTIAANAVALGTDTTGNYVATIADSGASEVTVTGSGSETAAITLALASGITRDTEWDTTTKINAATTDDDFLTLAGTQTVTGTKQFTYAKLDRLDLNQWNAGTIAGAATLTLVNTTNFVGANFSGSTANITLPASPTHDIFIYGTNSYNSGSQIITVSSSLLWTGRGYTSATLTNSSAADGRFILVCRYSGGAFVGLEAVGDAWSSGGSGTVTSVAQSFTGGLISVAGSPVTSSGTLALTVAGTSGGVPYFSSGSTWASSGALTANSLVLGGGAGAAPATVAGITSDGVSVLNLGVNATTIGKVKMFGNTSGDATIQPAAVAGTATIQTLPATTGTLVNRVTTANGVSASNSDGALTVTLGAITPTTVNGNTITTGTGTLTLGTGKTLTANNTLTLAGTDSTTMTFPTTSATIARTDAANTFSGIQSMTSPDFTTSVTTPSASFTAFAGATTLLTIGGTGASASMFAPSTLDATSSTTGAIRTSGGISAAKALNVGTSATIGGLTASQAVVTDASKVLTSVAYTGSGNVMRTRTGVWRSMSLLPTAWLPGRTNPATAGTNSITGTTDQSSDRPGFWFAETQTNRINLVLTMPYEWDATTAVKFQFWDSTTNTTASTYVKLWARGRAYADNSNPNAAWGTAVSATNTVSSTSGYPRQSTKTGAMTISGSLTAGQPVELEVYRDPSDAGDTAVGAALLESIVMFWQESATEPTAP